MDATTPTRPVYETKTCPRCKGAGEYRGYGMCYGCSGRGTVEVYSGRRRPLTAEEMASHEEYLAGEAARAARKAARAAERAARAQGVVADDD